MKVGELKKRLEHVNDEEEVRIEIKMPFTTVGGIPTVGVKFAHSGFDWDNGKFMLTPEENLTPADRDFETKMKDMQDKLGWLEYEKRGLKSEIKKLKKQLGVSQ